jgi:hypothetical protein
VQALLVGAALLGVLLGLGAAHLRDQGLGAALEVVAEGLQRLAHALAHAAAGFLVQAQRLGAGLGHAAAVAVMCVCTSPSCCWVLCSKRSFMALGLFGQLRHGGLHHGANAIAGQLQAVAQAGAQRLVHRLRQARVGVCTSCCTMC